MKKIKFILRMFQSAFQQELKPTKIVIVVRTDLNMGSGKIASQCSHAAVELYREAQIKNEILLNHWLLQGQPKIVVQAKSEEELLGLYGKALDQNIVATLVQDAGRTQVASGTTTVLGIGPDLKEKIDLVTGHLKLL